MDNIATVLLSLFNNKNNRTNKKENYIGSNRERTTREKNWSITRKELFLSDWNTKELTSAIYHGYKDLINGPYTRNYFITNVSNWMNNWRWINDLNMFEDHKYNYVDTFVKINRTFITETLNKLRPGINTAATYDIKAIYNSGEFNELSTYDTEQYYDPVPYFKASGMYTPPDYSEVNIAHDITKQNNEYFHQTAASIYNTSNKQVNDGNFNNMGEILIEEIKREAAESTPKRDYFDVEDYRSLDAWDDNYQVYTSNDKYRYHNVIPLDRRGLHKRHYDRGNEGLRGRSSVVNDRSRKYDLSDIEANNYYWN